MTDYPGQLYMSGGLDGMSLAGFDALPMDSILGTNDWYKPFFDAQSIISSCSGPTAINATTLPLFNSPLSVFSDPDTGTISSPSANGDQFGWTFMDNGISGMPQSSPSQSNSDSSLGASLEAIMSTPQQPPKYSNTIVCRKTGKILSDRTIKGTRKTTVANSATVAGVQSRRKAPLPPIYVEDLQDPVLLKRAKNTLAARESRRRKDVTTVEMQASLELAHARNEEQALQIQNLNSTVESITALLLSLGYTGPMP